MKNLIF